MSWCLLHFPDCKQKLPQMNEFYSSVTLQLGTNSSCDPRSPKQHPRSSVCASEWHFGTEKQLYCQRRWRHTQESHCSLCYISDAYLTRSCWNHQREPEHLAETGEHIYWGHMTVRPPPLPAPWKHSCPVDGSQVKKLLFETFCSALVLTFCCYFFYLNLSCVSGWPAEGARVHWPKEVQEQRQCRQ